MWMPPNKKDGMGHSYQHFNLCLNFEGSVYVYVHYTTEVKKVVNSSIKYIIRYKQLVTVYVIEILNR